MKNFVILTGPQAVGKMAVGLAIKEAANYRLFHNHMSIEFVIDLYGELTKENRRLVSTIRDNVFDDVVTQNINFTFTFVWGFNLEADHKYIHNLIKKFESHDWKVFIIELEAGVKTRLERNITPLRLEQKASKRNVEWSNNELVKSMDKYRLNSDPGEITHPYYLRINNENKSPERVTEEILNYIKSK